MQEQELEALDRCLDCGELVDEELGRAFAFGEDGLLCRQCAERRGGEYEPTEDRWLIAPQVSDLVERHLVEV